MDEIYVSDIVMSNSLIGNRIRDLQGKGSNRLKNDVMADIMKLEPHKFRRVCAGTRSLAPDEALRLCVYFERTLTWIYFGVEPEEIGIREEFPKMDFDFVYEVLLIKIEQSKADDLVSRLEKLNKAETIIIERMNKNQ